MPTLQGNQDTEIIISESNFTVLCNEYKSAELFKSEVLKSVKGSLFIYSLFFLLYLTGAYFKLRGITYINFQNFPLFLFQIATNNYHCDSLTYSRANSFFDWGMFMCYVIICKSKNDNNENTSTSFESNTSTNSTVIHKSPNKKPPVAINKFPENETDFTRFRKYLEQNLTVT